MNIKSILKILKTAPRSGTEKDEPEGSRYIQISDTLTNQMVEYLEDYILYPIE